MFQHLMVATAGDSLGDCGIHMHLGPFEMILFPSRMSLHRSIDFPFLFEFCFVLQEPPQAHPFHLVVFHPRPTLSPVVAKVWTALQCRMRKPYTFGLLLHP